MNSNSSSSGWRYGLLCFLAGAAAVYILVEHTRLTSEIAVLRNERHRLEAEQHLTLARLESVETKLTELESRPMRMDGRFNRIERPFDQGGPGQGGPGQGEPGNPPRGPAFRNRTVDVVNRFAPPPPPGPLPTPPTDARRRWGPEQASGPPDTTVAGDFSTAWASREPDGGPEWLRLEFEKEVEVAQVRIRETYNPGAITKVVGLAGNSEQVLWEGNEEPAPAPREFTIPVTGNVSLRTVVVHLDTTRVPGWNEIDAVELVGKDGSRQWAQSATASSTFASAIQPTPDDAPESIQAIPAPRRR
jgi:hypothetical protein